MNPRPAGDAGREVPRDMISRRRLLAAGGVVAVTHLALDAPVLHLVNAGGASNEVKFKAGAELSKSVN